MIMYCKLPAVRMHLHTIFFVCEFFSHYFCLKKKKFHSQDLLYAIRSSNKESIENYTVSTKVPACHSIIESNTFYALLTLPTRQNPFLSSSFHLVFLLFLSEKYKRRRGCLIIQNRFILHMTIFSSMLSLSFLLLRVIWFWNRSGWKHFNENLTFWVLKVCYWKNNVYNSMVITRQHKRKNPLLQSQWDLVTNKLFTITFLGSPISVSLICVGKKCCFLSVSEFKWPSIGEREREREGERKVRWVWAVLVGFEVK